MILFISSKETAAEAHQKLQNIGIDTAPAEKPYCDCFRHGGPVIENRLHVESLKPFKDVELDALSDVDSFQRPKYVALAMKGSF